MGRGSMGGVGVGRAEARGWMESGEVFQGNSHYEPVTKRYKLIGLF